MSYAYAAERQKLFTDDGQRTFLLVRDNVNRLLTLAGAVRLLEVIPNHGSFDVWTVIACVDRLVELGEIRELTGSEAAGQHRVFVRARGTA